MIQNAVRQERMHEFFQRSREVPKPPLEKRDSKQRSGLALSHGFSPSNPAEHLHYKRRQTQKPENPRLGAQISTAKASRTAALSA